MPGSRHAWSMKGPVFGLTEQMKNDLYDEVNSEMMLGLGRAMESQVFRDVIGAESVAYIKENMDEFLADVSDGISDSWTEDFLNALNELLATQEGGS